LIGNVTNNQELLAARASFKPGVVRARGGRDCGKKKAEKSGRVCGLRAYWREYVTAA